MAKHRTLPPDDALQPAIERMKAIVAQSADTLLLAEGPPHPDWRLLDICAEATHYVTHAERDAAEFHARAHDAKLSPRGFWEGPDRAEADAIWAESRALDAKAVQCLRRAKKLRATTGAGIYAKAMLVRGSRTGAAELAMSLATDLLDNPRLRETLWAPVPDEAGGAP